MKKTSKGKLVLTKFRKPPNHYVKKKKSCYVERYEGTDAELVLDELGGYFVTALSPMALAGNTALERLVLGDDVYIISSFAVSDCTGLREVVLPDALQRIDAWAFKDCVSLRHIYLPEKIESIGQGAFAGCSALEYNECDGVRYLGSRTNPYFAAMRVVDSGCTSVQLHPETRVIGSGAFQGCDMLTEITIPEQVRMIGAFAFQHTYKLRDVYWNAIACEDFCAEEPPFADAGCDGYCIHIGAKVERLPNSDKGFFTDGLDSRLGSILFPSEGSALAFIGKDFFGGTQIEKLEMPSGVLPRWIFDYAFRNSTQLTEAYVQAEVIATNAFFRCTALKKVVIGAGTKRIEQFAFSECDALTEIVLEEPSGWFTKQREKLSPAQITEWLRAGSPLERS